jgi:hypothetical protein
MRITGFRLPERPRKRDWPLISGGAVTVVFVSLSPVFVRPHEAVEGHFRHIGAKAGIYSTASQWNPIAGPLAVRRRLWHTPDSGHARPSAPGPYDMNAAIMQSQRHERGSHVV